MNDIISKWVVNYKDWRIAITEDGRVFCLKSNIELVEYWNNGTISYRLPNTTKRIGVKTMRKHCRLQQAIIERYCPF